MREPAYITIAEDGRLTLFWGDGTEPERIAILRGPHVTGGRELIQIIEEMKAWAYENGYDVIVPARDLVIPPVDLSILAHDSYPECVWAVHVFLYPNLASSRDAQVGR